MSSKKVKAENKYPGLRFVIFAKTSGVTPPESWFECVLCSSNTKMVPKEMVSHMRSWGHLENLMKCECPKFLNDYHQNSNSSEVVKSILEYESVEIPQQSMVAANPENIEMKRTELLALIESLQKQGDAPATEMLETPNVRPEQNTQSGENENNSQHHNDVIDSGSQKFGIVESSNENSEYQDPEVFEAKVIKHDSLDNAAPTCLQETLTLSSNVDMPECQVFNEGFQGKMFLLVAFENLYEKMCRLVEFHRAHPFYECFYEVFMGLDKEKSDRCQQKELADEEVSFISENKLELARINGTLCLHRRVVVPNTLLKKLCELFHQELRHPDEDCLERILESECHFFVHPIKSLLKEISAECNLCCSIREPLKKAHSLKVLGAYNVWPNRRELRSLNITDMVKLSYGRNPSRVVIISDYHTEALSKLSIENVHVRFCAGLTLESTLDAIKSDQFFSQGTLFVVLSGLLSILKFEMHPECISWNCPSPLQLPSTIHVVKPMLNYLIKVATNIHEAVLNSSPNDDVIFGNIIPIDIGRNWSNECKSHKQEFGHSGIIYLNTANPVVQRSMYQRMAHLYNEWTDKHASSLGYSPWNVGVDFFNVDNLDNLRIKINRDVFDDDGVKLSPSLNLSPKYEELCKGLLDRLLKKEKNGIMKNFILTTNQLASRHTTSKKFDFVLIFTEVEWLPLLRDLASDRVFITGENISEETISNLSNRFDLQNRSSLWIYTSGISHFIDTFPSKDCQYCPVKLPFSKLEKNIRSSPESQQRKVEEVLSMANNLVKMTKGIVGQQCSAIIFPLLPIFVLIKDKTLHENIHAAFQNFPNVILSDYKSLSPILCLYDYFFSSSVRVSVESMQCEGLYPSPILNFCPEISECVKIVDFLPDNVASVREENLYNQWRLMLKDTVYLAFHGFPPYITPKKDWNLFNSSSSVYLMKNIGNRAPNRRFNNVVLFLNSSYKDPLDIEGRKFIKTIQIDIFSEEIQNSFREIESIPPKSLCLYLSDFSMILENDTMSDLCRSNNCSLSLSCKKLKTVNGLDSYQMIEKFIRETRKKLLMLSNHINESSFFIVAPLCPIGAMHNRAFEYQPHNILHQMSKSLSLISEDYDKISSVVNVFDNLWNYLMESFKPGVGYPYRSISAYETLKNSSLYFVDSHTSVGAASINIQKWSTGLKSFINQCLNMRIDGMHSDCRAKKEEVMGNNIVNQGSAFPSFNAPSFPGNQPIMPPFPGNQPNLPPFPGNLPNLPQFPGNQPHGPPFPGNQPNLPPFPGNPPNLPPFPGNQPHVPTFNRIPPNMHPSDMLQPISTQNFNPRDDPLMFIPPEVQSLPPMTPLPPQCAPPPVMDSHSMLSSSRPAQNMFPRGDTHLEPHFPTMVAPPLKLISSQQSSSLPGDIPLPQDNIESPLSTGNVVNKLKSSEDINKKLQDLPKNISYAENSNVTLSKKPVLYNAATKTESSSGNSNIPIGKKSVIHSVEEKAESSGDKGSNDSNEAPGVYKIIIGNIDKRISKTHVIKILEVFPGFLSFEKPRLFQHASYGIAKFETDIDAQSCIRLLDHYNLSLCQLELKPLYKKQMLTVKEPDEASYKKDAEIRNKLVEVLKRLNLHADAGSNKSKGIQIKLGTSVDPNKNETEADTTKKNDQDDTANNAKESDTFDNPKECSDYIDLTEDKGDFNDTEEANNDNKFAPSQASKLSEYLKRKKSSLLDKWKPDDKSNRRERSRSLERRRPEKSPSTERRHYGRNFHRYGSRYPSASHNSRYSGRSRSKSRSPSRNYRGRYSSRRDRYSRASRSTSSTSGSSVERRRKRSRGRNDRASRPRSSSSSSGSSSSSRSRSRSKSRSKSRLKSDAAGGSSQPKEGPYFRIFKRSQSPDPKRGRYRGFPRGMRPGFRRPFRGYRGAFHPSRYFARDFPHVKYPQFNKNGPFDPTNCEEPRKMIQIRITNTPRLVNWRFFDDLLMACGSPAECLKNLTEKELIGMLPSLKRAQMVKQHLHQWRLADKTLRVEILADNQEMEEKISMEEDMAIAKEIEFVYTEYRESVVLKAQGDIMKEPDIFTFKIFKCEVAQCREFDCHYYHNPYDRRRDYLEVFYNDKTCSSPKASNECPRGDKCTFCHNNMERIYHPKNFKSNVCLDWYDLKRCPKKGFCVKYHPLSSDCFFSDTWKDLFIAGLDQSFQYFGGAIKLLFKIPDNEGGIPLLFITPNSDIARLAQEIVKPIAHIHRLKSAVILDNLQDPGGAHILIGTPSGLAKLIDSKGTAPLGGLRVLIIDDITTQINNPYHEQYIKFIIKSVYSEITDIRVLCKVVLSETCHSSEISQAEEILSCKFTLCNPHHVDPNQAPCIIITDSKDENDKVLQENAPERSLFPVMSAEFDTQKDENLSDWEEDKNMEGNKTKAPIKDKPMLETHISLPKRSRVDTPVAEADAVPPTKSRSEKTVVGGEAPPYRRSRTDKATIEVGVAPTKRSRSSSESSSSSSSSSSSRSTSRERNSSDDEGKFTILAAEVVAEMQKEMKEFIEEHSAAFEVYVEVPEMHPSYEEKYEKFLKSYEKKYKSTEETEHLSKMWSKYWKLCIEHIRKKEVQLKKREMFDKYKQKSDKLIAEPSKSKEPPIMSTSAILKAISEISLQPLGDFTVEGALSLLNNLSDKVTGDASVTVKEIIASARSLGINTKNAMEHISSDNNIVLLNCFFENVLVDCQNLMAEDMQLYKKGISWGLHLIKYAKEYKEKKPVPSTPKVRFDVNLFAKQTFNRDSKWIYETLEKSLQYVHGNKPSDELIKETFTKISAIHFNMASTTPYLVGSVPTPYINHMSSGNASVFENVNYQYQVPSMNTAHPIDPSLLRNIPTPLVHTASSSLGFALNINNPSSEIITHGITPGMNQNSSLSRGNLNSLPVNPPHQQQSQHYISSDKNIQNPNVINAIMDMAKKNVSN